MMIIDMTSQFAVITTWMDVLLVASAAAILLEGGVSFLRGVRVVRPSVHQTTSPV